MEIAHLRPRRDIQQDLRIAEVEPNILKSWYLP